MATEGASKPILGDWRQGDYSLDADLEIPVLVDNDGEASFGGADGAGMVLISQSCDILRDHNDRPHVQVSPLLKVSADELRAIAGRRKPQFATFAALAELGLAVDLDIVATVEKAVVKSWQRSGGCANDDERQEFAAALARHKRRFAFTDEFNRAIQQMRRWLQRRAQQNNNNGDMIRAIEQIRVRCPDWDAEPLDLEFICVLNREPTLGERRVWRASLVELEATVTPSYPNAFVRLATPNELSLAEYRSSARLDLDGLSDA
jgi:hypothetical protein